MTGSEWTKTKRQNAWTKHLRQRNTHWPTDLLSKGLGNHRDSIRIGKLSLHPLECKSVRSKVVSIDGRFDRQKSIRSKTSISSIKVWISSPPTLNLSSTKVSGQVDVFSLPNVRSEHTPLEKLIFFSRSMDKWKVNIFLARWKKFLLVSYFFFFWRDQLKTTFPRRARILHRAIITQHKNFYYYLYACKAVVFIIIYSSIELTLGFDRNDLRSKRPSKISFFPAVIQRIALLWITWVVSHLQQYFSCFLLWSPTLVLRPYFEWFESRFL